MASNTQFLMQIVSAGAGRMPVISTPTRFDRAFVQPAATQCCRRGVIKPMAAIAAPPKTKLNTQKSEEVSLTASAEQRCLRGHLMAPAVRHLGSAC